MFVDIACRQMKKYNQNAYGDYFASRRKQDEGRLIAVLSDGLGSGIKANILSCMTATMLLNFLEKEVDIGKAAEIIMNSLPVCRVRKISYATFSAADCDDDGNVKLVEEGNPDFLWLDAQGNEKTAPHIDIQSETFKNRCTKVCRFKAELGDRVILCSDGVTQAGLGSPLLKLGLRREGELKIVQKVLAACPEISSDDLAARIVEAARLTEPDNSPKDDVSACVLYFRNPRDAVVFTGPPYRKEDDSRYAHLFQNMAGKKAICGGTTANLLSRELNLPVTVDMALNVGSLPGCSHMDGADLVTEGILTLTKTAEYLEKGIPDTDDAAVRLAHFLLDSDRILFMTGAQVNQAHYDPTLPIEIEIRKNVVRRMTETLKTKYFKQARIEYM